MKSVLERPCRLYLKERESDEEVAACMALSGLAKEPTATTWSTRFKNSYLAEMRSGSEEDSYSRFIDLSITQLQA